MKKINISHYIILLLSMILFIVSVFLNPYSFSYLAVLVLILLLALLVFSTGIIINKQEFYQKNITKYIILYFVLLLSLTMFINRPGVSFFNKEFLEDYTRTINIIPFKTIISYLTGIANIGIKITNILGNLIAFVPLSFLLMLKDKKYCKLKKQFVVLAVTVFVIEILQLVTSTGRFDIDDFILNIGGGLLFVILLNKVKLIDKLKRLFYQDFHIPKIGKIILWSITFLFIILVDIMMLVNMVTIEQVITQTFYVSNQDRCSELEKIEMEGYHLYLDCVDVVYETEDNYQMSLQEALENGELTRKDIKEKLEQKETLWDGGTATYVNPKENIAFVLCRTTEGNKDIYVGNKNLRYEESFCK